MFPENHKSSYYSGCNVPLLRAVPPEARRILEVGCALGHLGAALKHGRPDRTVFGIELQPAVAASAAERLDRVFASTSPRTTLLWSCTALIACSSATFWSISSIPRLCCDVTAASWLPTAWCSPRSRIFSTTRSWPRSRAAIFSTHPPGCSTPPTCGSSPARPSSSSSWTPAMSRACWMPSACPVPPRLAEAAGPLLDYLGLNRARTVDQLDVYQHIVLGRPLEELEPAQDDRGPVTFVACVSDDAILGANLLASPCLEPGSPHETDPGQELPERRGWVEYRPGPGQARVGRLRTPGCLPAQRLGSTAGAAAPRGRAAALGRSGSRASMGSARLAHRNHRDRLLAAERVGWVVDRGRLLREGPELPARVATLDELLLVVPRDTPLRFDPALGFHLYGADLCLQAAERGLAVVALGALCHHNSRSIGLPDAVFSQRRGLRPQMGAPAARGHVVRHHRPRGEGMPAGEYAVSNAEVARRGKNKKRSRA